MISLSKCTTPYFSRYGFFCVILFIAWTLLLRLVLPFGDEPDFSVRVVELVEVDEHPFWVPYYWMGSMLKELQIQSICKIDASPIAFWGHIDSETCLESLNQIAIRTLITIVCCAPLLWAVVYRRSLQKTLRLFGSRSTDYNLNKRLDALCTALLIPGMIYYLGLLSHEQFSLAVSLLISVVWGHWFLMVGLAAYTMAIDLGNGVVVFGFYAIYILTLIIFKYFGWRWLTLFFMGLCIIFIAYGYELLSYVKIIDILSAKAEAIYIKSQTADYLEKYPNFLRPVVTYITAIFMLPSGIKAIGAHVLFAIVIVVGVIKIYQKLKNTKKIKGIKNINQLQLSREYIVEIILPMIAGLMTIIAFCLILPDYANAKYYMFLMPFFALPFVYIFKNKVRLLFLHVSFSVVFLSILLQYILIL